MKKKLPINLKFKYSNLSKSKSRIFDIIFIKNGVFYAALLPGNFRFMPEDRQIQVKKILRFYESKKFSKKIGILSRKEDYFRKSEFLQNIYFHEIDFEKIFFKIN